VFAKVGARGLGSLWVLGECCRQALQQNASKISRLERASKQMFWLDTESTFLYSFSIKEDLQTVLSRSSLTMILHENLVLYELFAKT
jgi:hypothetical protein